MGRPAQVVNEIIRGKKQITAETALDLERALGISAGFWVRLQADYDLVKARLASERKSGGPRSRRAAAKA
jgi:addiction module HigA family antidote